MAVYTEVFPSHDLLFIPSVMVQCESFRKLRGLGDGVLKSLGTWNGYTRFPFLVMVIWRVIQLSKCNTLSRAPGYLTYSSEAVMSESHSRPIPFFQDQ